MHAALGVSRLPRARLVRTCGWPAQGAADCKLWAGPLRSPQPKVPYIVSHHFAGAEAGGRSVDAALFALLRGHVGPEVWDEWKKLHPGEWTELSSK